MLTQLFDYTLSNQLVLSVLLVSLIVLQRYALPYIGASFNYKLWCLVPIALVLFALPEQLKPMQYESMYNIQVTISSLNNQLYWPIPWEIFYCIGIIALLSLLLWQYQTFNRQLKLSNSFDWPTTIYTSENITSPMVVGFINPKLVLPSNYQTQFNTSALALIIEHEQVHIRRKDNLANIAMFMMYVINWFNPIVWFAYQSFRRSQELACDALVLKNKTEQQSLIYAKALIMCVENTSNNHFTYAQYGDKYTMLQRLNQLKNTNSPSTVMKVFLISIAVSSMATMALVKTHAPTHSEKKPIVEPTSRVEPKYPLEAAKNNVSGWVQLAFTIDTQGHTNNIRVIAEEPANTFASNAIAAVKQWRYTPSGNPSAIHSVQLDFILEGANQSNFANFPKQERLKVLNHKY